MTSALGVYKGSRYSMSDTFGEFLESGSKIANRSAFSYAKKNAFEKTGYIGMKSNEMRS